MNKASIALMVMAVLLAGCQGDAETVGRASNSEYKVETLFHFDGCTVYRFYDGRTVHYVKCDNADTTTRWQEGCGKNCTRPVDVSETLSGRRSDWRK